MGYVQRALDVMSDLPFTVQGSQALLEIKILHPWLMMVATAWVVFILHHREFNSRTLKALAEEDASPSLKT